mgnify:FL=1
MRQWREHQLTLATVLSVGLTVVAAAPAAVPNALAGPAESPGPDSAVVVKTWGLPPMLPVFSCAGGPVLLAPTKPFATEPSDYYAIELVPTGRVPGTRLSSGVAYSTAALSPFFGVALAPTGEYLHNLEIQIEGLKAPRAGAYVAWITDTEISQIVRLGQLDENFRASGQTGWNKFLVVITREPSMEPKSAWEGPIIMRGMSRSGRMHTLAGHGPFQAEPCAKYGFR